MHADVEVVLRRNGSVGLLPLRWRAAEEGSRHAIYHCELHVQLEWHALYTEIQQNLSYLNVVSRFKLNGPAQKINLN